MCFSHLDGGGGGGEVFREAFWLSIQGLDNLQQRVIRRAQWTGSACWAWSLSATPSVVVDFSSGVGTKAKQTTRGFSMWYREKMR